MNLTEKEYAELVSECEKTSLNIHQHESEIDQIEQVLLEWGVILNPEAAATLRGCRKNFEQASLDYVAADADEDARREASAKAMKYSQEILDSKAHLRLAATSQEPGRALAIKGRALRNELLQLTLKSGLLLDEKMKRFNK